MCLRRSRSPERSSARGLSVRLVHAASMAAWVQRGSFSSIVLTVAARARRSSRCRASTRSSPRPYEAPLSATPNSLAHALYDPPCIRRSSSALATSSAVVSSLTVSGILYYYYYYYYCQSPYAHYFDYFRS